MEKLKHILLKLLYPHPAITVVCTVLSAAGLFWVFGTGSTEHPAAYVCYPLSAYTLCVLVAGAIPAFAAVSRSPRVVRWRSRAPQRLHASLYNSLAINLGYAAFKMAVGVYFHSVWFGAAALYYMVLSLIRFWLVRGDRRTNRADAADVLATQWRSCRTCGRLLLVLNATMTGMAFQMIWQNRSSHYPGFVIYLSAGYTFYRFIAASVRSVRMRGFANPIYTAAKALDLSVALMAVFSLQTAMLTSFGADLAEETRQMMNAITGGVVHTLVVCIALYLILRSRRALRGTAAAHDVGTQ
ncbi:MAG: hypothetical protein IJ484_07690 [Oscillospiraceae bacterium]|nr:hypothetical protein [Oscillospiraceae bacterium]